jgi:ATP-dependent Clp protease adaptor protein ClpS
MTAVPHQAEIDPAGRPGTTTIVRSEAVPLWNVVVWDDPVNLMSYVVWVFRNLFGYGEERATKLMLDVHHRGRAIVASAPRERAEHDVTRLHHHGLWATLEKG